MPKFVDEKDRTRLEKVLPEHLENGIAEEIKRAGYVHGDEEAFHVKFYILWVDIVIAEETSVESKRPKYWYIVGDEERQFKRTYCAEIQAINDAHDVRLQKEREQA